MNSTAKIPVAKIAIEQVEGRSDNLLKVTVFTWADAARALRQIKQTAPTNGTYYKTDVVVTWANGQTTQVREDVMNTPDYAGDLAMSIRRRWQFYAGFHQPAHYTEEDYTKMVASDVSRRDAATAMLKSFLLEDITPAPADPKPVTVDRKADIVAATKPMRMHDWPTKAEIGHLGTMVAGMIKRVEDPLMRGHQSAEAIRDLSLELRKALKALIRAEDLHHE